MINIVVFVVIIIQLYTSQLVDEQNLNPDTSNEHLLAKQKLNLAKDEFKHGAEDLYDSGKHEAKAIKNKFMNAKQAVKSQGNVVTNTVNEFVSDVLDVDELESNIEQGANVVKEHVYDQANKAKDKAENLKEGVKKEGKKWYNFMGDVKDNVEEKAHKVKNKAKQSVKNIVEEEKAKVEQLKKNIINKSKAHKERLKAKTKRLQQEVSESIEAIKQFAEDRIDDVIGPVLCPMFSLYFGVAMMWYALVFKNDLLNYVYVKPAEEASPKRNICRDALICMAFVLLYGLEINNLSQLLLHGLGLSILVAIYTSHSHDLAYKDLGSNILLVSLFGGSALSIVAGLKGLLSN